jgi:hypothetical protein
MQKCNQKQKRDKRSKRRYYLHAKVKNLEPEDYKLLNPRKRRFSGIPNGKYSNKLLKEFDYEFQYRII